MSVLSNSSSSGSDAENVSFSINENISTKSRCATLYKQYTIFVSAGERGILLKRNQWVRAFSEHLKVITVQSAATFRDSVRNNLVIGIRIMKYCSPDHDINQFLWDQFTYEKITELLSILRDDMKLKATSVANYIKVAKNMCQSIQSNGALMAKNRYHSASMGSMLQQFNLLAKTNSRMISKDRVSLAKQEVSKQAGHFESRFQQYHDAFDKATSDARKLLESTKTHLLTQSETFMVNAYFNFLCLMQGQRPMVLSINGIGAIFQS